MTGLVQQAVQCVATPSKVFDLRYPDGNDGSGTVASWASSIPDFLQQQGGFSINVASYLTIISGTATYAILSGAVTGNWACSSVGMFTGTSLGGPTTFRIRATISGTTFDSPTFQVESIATPGSADVTAPTKPRGLALVAKTDTYIDVSVDCPADVPAASGTEDCKGMKEIRLFKNGTFDGAVSMTPGMSIKFALGETPALDNKRFPGGHYVSASQSQCIKFNGALGTDGAFPNGAIPGGSTGTIASGGVSWNRTTRGPAVPGITMICFSMPWRLLEPTKSTSVVPGNPGYHYDFSVFMDSLAQCAALGVYFLPMIYERSFGGHDGDAGVDISHGWSENPMPSYSLSQGPMNAAPYCTAYSTVAPSGKNGYQGSRWNTEVLQRFQLLMQAFKAEFDFNTGIFQWLAGFCTQETAADLTTGEQHASGYTAVGYNAGLKSQHMSIRSALTWGRHWAFHNWLPDDPDDSNYQGRAKTGPLLDDYFRTVAAGGGVMGGPDILPDNSGLVTWVYPRYRQFKGIIRKMCSAQNNSYKTSHSLTYLVDWAQKNLGLSGIMWNLNGGGAQAFYGATDNALDVIAAELAATPAQTPFGPFRAGSCVQSGVDYTVTSNWEQSNTDGTSDSYSCARATLSGAVYFSATLDSVTGPLTDFSYAGLAIRDAIGTDQRMVAIYVTGTGLYVGYRSATGGKLTIVTSVAGVSWTTPTDLMIIRDASNNFIFTYSKGGGAWSPLPIAPLNVAMTDPVTADAFCVSGGYATTTAVFKSLCAQNIAGKSYRFNSLTAGTQYTLTAKGRDLATTPNDSEASTPLVVTTSGVSAPVRKWDPGLYVYANGKATTIDDASTTFNNDITKIAAMGGVKGICLPYSAALFEPVTAGVYDYTLLDRDINRCSSAGKKIAIRINTLSYSGTTPVGAGVIPDYILADKSTYGTGSDGTHGGYWKRSGSGFTMATWRAQVMNRLIALVQALATHLDPANGNNLDVSTNVAWIEVAITDVLPAAASDYDSDDLITQLNRLMAAGVAAFPRTPFLLIAGTVTGAADADISGLVNSAASLKCAIGGLDIKGINTTLGNRYFDAQRAWCGSLDGSSVDQRGSMPIIQRVNAGELTGSQYASDGSPYSNADLQATLAFLGTNYAVWQIVNATGNGNWTTSVKPFLVTNPAVVATRPTGW